MRDFTPADTRLISNVAVQQEAATGRVTLTATAPNGYVIQASGDNHREATAQLRQAAHDAGYYVVA